MPKRIIKPVLVILLLMLCGVAVRSYMTKGARADTKVEGSEAQTIGTVSGYNPRVKEIQGILKNAGLDPGSGDGLMGARTRAAVKEFQKAKGLKPSGKIDSSTMLALNREKEAVRSIVIPVANEQLKPAGPDTKRVFEVQDEVLSYRLKSKDRMSQIQAALKKAGLYKGDIDGKSGPQTKSAIKEFQRSKGLIADGIVGQKTWDELTEYLRN